MSELPADLDPEELNEMIRDLGREKGLPPGISPDLIGPDPDDHNYWGYGQAERHKQSVAWRGKLIAELVKSPEWIAEWRAARELDQRIRRMCEAKGLQFGPWECPPWRAPDQLPEPSPDLTHMYNNTVPHAVRLRRRLIAEIEAEDARDPAETLG